MTMDSLILLSDIISYIISITYFFFRFTIEGRNKIGFNSVDICKSVWGGLGTNRDSMSHQRRILL